MKRDASGFRSFPVPLYTVTILALMVISLCSITTASALAPQGAGGRVQPTPTPKKATPPKKTTTPTRNSRASAPKTPARKAEPGADTAAEIAFWNSIKDSTNPEDFKAYLQEYPQGKFVSLAKNRLNTLEAPARAEAARKEEAKRKEDEAAATERTYWESIKNSNNLADFSEYLRRYPNGQFADLAKNRVNVLNNSRSTTSNPVSAPKPVAGAWPVPEVKGDSNCLDEPCKAIRQIVAAAPTDFKTIYNGDIRDEGFFSSKVFLPGFFDPSCRIFPKREGLAPPFYHCPYSSQTPVRDIYEKYLAALGRALPGWYFESQRPTLGGDTWVLAMAGPKECTLETCPVKLMLLESQSSGSPLLYFEVEAPHEKPEEMITESFKKQFLDDINALFTASSSDFLTVSETEQSFAKHGFRCRDMHTIAHSGRARRLCSIESLPMSRAERLFELARQEIRKHKPDWKTDYDLSRQFKVVSPAAACQIHDCGGAMALWYGDHLTGFGFSIDIENPPKKR